MTPRPPVDVKGKSSEELVKIIRDLETSCNAQDSGIHASSAREGRLFLANRAMRETLQKISDSNCGRLDGSWDVWVDIEGTKERRCIHAAAREVLAKVAAKEGSKT